MWDVASGKGVVSGGMFPGTVRDVQSSADGRVLTTSTGSAVRVWDTDSGKLLHRLDDLKMTALHLDKQGKFLQVWHPTMGMRVLDVATGKLRLRWKATGSMKDTEGAAFSPGGR